MNMKLCFLFSFLLTVAVAEEDAIHRHVARVHLKTGPSNRYQFLKMMLDQVIQFRVKAAFSAHLLLAHNDDYEKNYTTMVEVVIGHDNNQKSSIRMNNITLIEVDSPDLLNPNTYKDFYVRYAQVLDSGGSTTPNIDIEVGTGFYNASEPFLTYKGVAIHYLIYYTGFASDSNADWEVEVTRPLDDPLIPKFVQTFPHDEYQFFPVNGKSISFRVQVSQNAFVVLSQYNQASTPVIEVKIGTGIKHEYVTFTKDRSSDPQRATEFYPRLTSKEPRYFWIAWEYTSDAKLFIKMGADTIEVKGNTPILSYTYDDPFDIRFFGIKTPDRVGIWGIDDHIQYSYTDFHDHNRKRRSLESLESSQEKKIKTTNINITADIMVEID